jgi:shikimate kinase
MDWINQNGYSIYVKTRPSLLAKRLAEHGGRPLLAGKDATALAHFIPELLATRAGFYEQASAILMQEEDQEVLFEEQLEQIMRRILAL